MMPPRRSRAVAVGVGTAVSTAVALVMLWPALSSGYLLYRDFVTVPDPVLGAQALGWGGGAAPRAVPLDAVMALVDPVVPTWLQQKLMVIGSLVLAGAGVAFLLRRHGWVASAVGAAVATWSPYAVERLLLGQAPTLLSWATLPWLLEASRADGWRRRVVLMALFAAPAALTPFGGVVAAVVCIGLTVEARRGAKEVAAIGSLALGWCLPWALPALLGHSESGQVEGATAFRVQAANAKEVVDVFGGGGVWARGAALDSRGETVALVASVVLLGLALLGMLCIRRRRLAAVLLLGPPLLAVTLGAGPGLAVFAAAQSLPGVGLFRDTHRWLELSAMVVAVLGGLGAGVCDRWVRQRLGLVRRKTLGVVSVVTSVALVAGLTATAVLSAPDAPRRLHAAYVPVGFPAAWGDVVRTVAEGDVLVMPWQPIRRVPWNGSREFLDPLARALPGKVVSSQVLQVTRDGRAYEVGPRSADGGAWARGDVDVSSLRDEGVDFVLEWTDSPGRVATSHTGMRLVLDRDGLRLWVLSSR